MKAKNLLLGILVGIVQLSYGQVIQIPDANFKAALLADADINLNGDDEITVNEAIEASDIQVAGLSIADLKGIEYFTNLIFLDVSLNELSNLDISNLVNLTTLLCNNNLLTSLKLNEKIANLNCASNQLVNMDLTQNTNLLTLRCFNNQLTEIDLSQNTLTKELLVYNNSLTALNVTKCPDLTKLRCQNNAIEFLSVRLNPVIQDLNCSNNNLVNINLANGNSMGITSFKATGNSDLVCIQVGEEVDVSNPPASWQNTNNAEYKYDCNLVAIKDMNTSSLFTLYPNPTSDRINISADLDLEEVILRDSRGRLVARTVATSIDISNLPHGLYFIEIQSQEGIGVQRIIKN